MATTPKTNNGKKNDVNATATKPKTTNGVHTEGVAEGFQWPGKPADMLLAYLVAEVSDAHDAPNRAKPFINSNGMVHLHSSDWRAWLESQGLRPSKAEAALPLREAGLSVRAFPLPGEDRALGFYIGKAPKGTEKLPRRQVTRTARPRTPFGKLTDEQREVVIAALSAYKPAAKAKGEVRDELLAQLPTS